MRSLYTAVCALLIVAPEVMAKPCPADIVGPAKVAGGTAGPPDGRVTVEDLITLLGKWGSKKAPFDVVKTGGSKGVIDVEDLLVLLKTWGQTGCTKPGKTVNINWIIKTYKPMTASVGDTVSFAWSGWHNVYLHPSQSCSTRGATLVGSESTRKGSFKFTKPGKYTFACQVGSHCSMGQIVTFTVGGQGAPPPPPAPPPPAPPPPPPSCARGSLCGGQIQTMCGTNCPNICGKPSRPFCNKMCFRGIQCPRNMWWDDSQGKCLSSQYSCTGQG